MERRFEKAIYKLIKVCFCIVSALIFTVVLFVDKNIVYSPNSTLRTPVPNLVLILAPLLTVGVLFLFWRKWDFWGRISRFCHRRFYRILFPMAALFLLCQWFVAYHIYFSVGWDPGIVMGYAFDIAYHGKKIGEHYYYSQYTNNIAITAILALIQEIPCSVGLQDGCYLLCIFVDCVLVNLAGVLAALSLRRMIGSGMAGICTYVLFAVLTGISPWIVVPYTDTYGIVFPVLVLYLYLRAEKVHKDKWLLWLGIGLAGGFGLMLKPNSGVVFIAVIAIELVKLVGGEKKVRLAVLRHLAMLVVAGVLLSGCWRLMVSYTGAVLHENTKITYTHYLMMGLNEETAGAYNMDDYMFSSVQPTVADRQTANLQVVRERLKDYGPIGYLYFLVRKMLTNFNDGTFSWWMEGNFKTRDSYVEQTSLTLWLRQIFWGDGDRYFGFASFEQAVWLGILGLLLGMFFLKKEKTGSGEAVMLLSLLGLFAFVTLFEARGRYLYCMLPVYVLCAVYGLWLGVHRFRKKDT